MILFRTSEVMIPHSNLNSIFQSTISASRSLIKKCVFLNQSLAFLARGRRKDVQALINIFVNPRLTRALGVRELITRSKIDANPRPHFVVSKYRSKIEVSVHWFAGVLQSLFSPT